MSNCRCHFLPVGKPSARLPISEYFARAHIHAGRSRVPCRQEVLSRQSAGHIAKDHTRRTERPQEVSRAAKPRPSRPGVIMEYQEGRGGTATRHAGASGAGPRADRPSPCSSLRFLNPETLMANLEPTIQDSKFKNPGRSMLRIPKVLQSLGPRSFWRRLPPGWWACRPDRGRGCHHNSG